MTPISNGAHIEWFTMWNENSIKTYSCYLKLLLHDEYLRKYKEK